METRNRLKTVDYEEIISFCEALKIDSTIEYPFICTAGTGGDPKRTINVSSATALIVASMDGHVFKLGSGGITKQFGSREFFNELGIETGRNLEQTMNSVKQYNFGFFDFRNLIPVTERAKIRSPLHLIGPIAHPLNIDYKLFGCANKGFYNCAQKVLPRLYKSYIISYNTVMDEVSIFTPTLITAKVGNENEFVFEPQKVGIVDPSEREILSGDSPYMNAGRIVRLMQGKDRTSLLELIAVNSGCALYLTGKASNIEEGYFKSKEFILSGYPYQYLKEKINFLGNPQKLEKLEADFRD